MGESFKIDVDVGRLLADVNTKLYESSESVVDELVQNAQRAGARRLEVRLAGPSWQPGRAAMIVRDDGCGLTNPVDLLRLAHSGWSQDVVEDVEPFGMGFWSTATVADTVLVRSNEWAIRIDAARLRETRSVEGVVMVTRQTESVPGFEATLVAPAAVAQMRRWDKKEEATSERSYRLMRAWWRLVEGLQARLCDLVRYAEFDLVRLGTTTGQFTLVDEALDAAGGGNLEWSSIPSRLLLTAVPDGLVYARVVERDGLRGVLWPQTSAWDREPGSWNSGIRWFTQRREVEKQDASLGGVLHVEGIATPRAPDRRAWLRDERYDGITRMLHEEGRELYRGFLGARPDLAGRYDEAIARFLTGADLVELLPVEIAAAEKAERSERIEGGDMPEPPENGPRAAVVVPLQLTGALPDRIEVQTPETPETRAPRRLGDVRDSIVCYVELDRLADNVEAMQLARKMGLTVLMLPSKCGRIAVATLRERGRMVLHVSDVRRGLKRKFVADKRPINSDVLKIWRSVRLQLMGAFATDVPIDVRHLTRTSVVEVETDDGTVELPVEDAKSVLLGAAIIGGALILELEHVLGAIERSREHSPLRDLQVVLELMPTVAHELAHLLTKAGDGTQEHAEATEQLLSDALRRLAGVL